MKLYSDRGNPLLLRILAARNLSGVSLTVHFINDDGMSAVLCAWVRVKLKVKEKLYLSQARVSYHFLYMLLPCTIYLNCADMLICTSSG